MSRKAAYCGLYCGACCSMIRQEKDVDEPSVRNIEPLYDEQPCMGCDADYQQNCEFVKCNKAHGTDSCALCPEFPCAMITKFKDDEWKHHIVVLDNLHRIKEIGIEAWLDEQKQYWQCPSCGARTQWYQNKCSVCGETIVNNI